MDILGFIPVVGAVADLANAAIYTARGDYKNAALNALSAVPGVGDAAAATKLGLKGAKALKVVTKSAKLVESAINIYDMGKDLKSGDFLSLGARILGPVAAKGLAKVGAKAVSKVGKSGVLGKFKQTKVGNAYASFKKTCKCNRFFGKCFTGDTLVCTEYGYIPIRDVDVGSLVYSMNEDTGQIGLKHVEQVSKNTAHTKYSIQINGNITINTTAYHQFFVEEQGWVNVINLKVSDRLITKEGVSLVTRTEKNRYDDGVSVYNFHIEDWASYFATKFEVYVHNHAKHESIKELKPNDIKDAIKDERKELDKPLALQLGDKDEIKLATQYAGKSTDDYFNVIGHGNENGIEFDEKIRNAEEIALLIKKSPQYIKGGNQKIVLYSCETGKLPNGFAQQLADILNTKVEAPNMKIWTNKSGGFTIADIIDGKYRRGEWVTFMPHNKK